MTELAGKVYSHTTIRVPGNKHINAAPFVLLIVDLDSGERVLGHFAGSAPPLIDARVCGNASDTTPVFSLVERNDET
jgi:uncharacterized OB-fold protein